MTLTVDIGNTNITFGVFKEKKLLKKLSLPTEMLNGFRGKVRKSFSSYKIRRILVCSVVPKAERPLISVLWKVFKVKPSLLGKDIKIPIKNLYKNPRQVGHDRLVVAYAGCMLYKVPLIMIDFGTAVTFDVISRRKEYLGGIIVPGVKLSLRALQEKAALLPQIKLKKAKTLLGRTTKESMTSGILYGYGAMCDGLVSKLNKKFRCKFNVIATGGNARLISRYTRVIKKLDEDLVLKGINLISLNLKKSLKSSET